MDCFVVPPRNDGAHRVTPFFLCWDRREVVSLHWRVGKVFLHCEPAKQSMPLCPITREPCWIHSPPCGSVDPVHNGSTVSLYENYGTSVGCSVTFEEARRSDPKQNMDSRLCGNDGEYNIFLFLQQ